MNLRIFNFGTRLRQALMCLAISILALGELQLCEAAPRFHHISMEDGLSNNEVYQIIQDSKGYIWLATADGLNRYDGYSFKVFRHQQNNPDSLSGNFVNSTCEDSKGRLWLTPYPNGIDLYNPDTETFKHYRHVTGDPDSPISDSITFLRKLKDGRILVGTSDAGLDILDPNTSKFTHVPVGASPAAPLDNHYNTVQVDHQGRVWLGTADGFDLFDPSLHTPLRHYETGAKDERGRRVVAIAEDEQHRLWLGTHDGVYVYSTDPHMPGSAFNVAVPGPKELKDALINDIFVDNRQNVWFMTITSGIYVLIADSGHIRHYSRVAGNPDSLTSNTTNGAFEDNSGLIWINMSDGLSILDPHLMDIYSLKPSDIKGNDARNTDAILAMLQNGDKLLMGGFGGVYQYSLNSEDDGLTDKSNVFMTLDMNRYGPINALAKTSDHNLFMSTSSGHLLMANAQGRILKSWLPRADLNVPNYKIKRILVENKDTIYLGTFGSGLLLFNPTTGKSRSISGDTKSELETTDRVEDLLQVSPDIVWAGTFRGVFMLDTRTQRSTLIPMTPGNIEPVVQSLYEDKQHMLWVGTYAGLWKIPLDVEGRPTATPEQVPALSSTQVLAIEQDSEGIFWLATVNSLVRFDPRKGDMLTFGRDQGSPMSEYYSYGHLRTLNGWVWFAGGQGAIGFSPQALRPNSHPPQVALSDMSIYRDGKQIPMLLPE